MARKGQSPSCRALCGEQLFAPFVSSYMNKLKFIRWLLIIWFAGICGGNAPAAELPTLHLRKTPSPPPLVTMLQDPTTASLWYPSSPTWFGMGGKTGGRNHTEVLVTYDDTALYVAFLNIDRATFPCPAGVPTDLTTVDSDAIWVETPAGNTFYLIAALDSNYPPGPVQASGEFPSFDPKSDKLPGWSHVGESSGGNTFQQTIRIPWSALGMTAPTLGSSMRVNFANYNQTAPALTAATVDLRTWAPGNQSQPDQWGKLAFDEAAYTPPTGISPEATITLRPATGFGGEVTMSPGNDADQTNSFTNEAITQSNWNDWDPVDYTLKEFMQFDLTTIPPGRKIISATLLNNFRGHYNSNPTDLYLHVVRLAQAYDPATVTMLTSPVPIENGYRRLVQVSEVGDWIDFDVTDAVTKALASGSSKVSLALAGTSGDISNGKIWNVSYGRADWYDNWRPQLIITFGRSDESFASPLQLGTFNYTSAATTACKNKITNGTFRYGTLEGYTNTSYWQTPGSVYINGQNVPLAQMDGDINPNTGDPALRFLTPVSWEPMRQIATGLVGGQNYFFSGWYKGSAPGIESDIGIELEDASGNGLASTDVVYNGSGNWEQMTASIMAPANTAQALMQITNYTSAPNTYMLYSDLQFEAGTSFTPYSETKGVYCPTYPSH